MKTIIFIMLKTFEIGLFLVIVYLWHLFYDWINLDAWMVSLKLWLQLIIILILMAILIFCILNFSFKKWIAENKNLAKRIVKKYKL